MVLWDGGERQGTPLRCVPIGDSVSTVVGEPSRIRGNSYLFSTSPSRQLALVHLCSLPSSLPSSLPFLLIPPLLSSHGLWSPLLPSRSRRFRRRRKPLPLRATPRHRKGRFRQGTVIPTLFSIPPSCVRVSSPLQVRVVEHRKTKKLFALKYINKAQCVKQKAVANIIQERQLLEEVSPANHHSPLDVRLIPLSLFFWACRSIILSLSTCDMHSRTMPTVSSLLISCSAVTFDVRCIFFCSAPGCSVLHLVLIFHRPHTVHLERKGTMDEAAVRFWVAELSCALRYLHKQRIIHR